MECSVRATAEEALPELLRMPINSENEEDSTPMNAAVSSLTVSMLPGIEVMTVRPDIPHRRLTDEEFEQFVAQNPELKVEMTSDGALIIMSLTTMKGGHRIFLLTTRFGIWAEADNTGVGFDSSTCFTLPNGAKRSPDASWVHRERWDMLTEEEKDQFTHICPDFVVELRPKTDRLKPLQEKLEEYILNGAQLGWLIDPIEKKVHLYRADFPIEILDNPRPISGEPLLNGFTLNLAGILD
jgi:Uma2 family endonuclease